MAISQDTISEIGKLNGAESTAGDDDTAPYGYTFVGALNIIEREMEQADEFGQTYSDLPADKQTEIKEAHGALQYHISRLSNVLANDMVGKDDQIELPNGSTLTLPKAATTANSNADIPSGGA